MEPLAEVAEDAKTRLKDVSVEVGAEAQEGLGAAMVVKMAAVAADEIIEVGSFQRNKT